MITLEGMNSSNWRSRASGDAQSQEAMDNATRLDQPTTDLDAYNRCGRVFALRRTQRNAGSGVRYAI